MNPFQNTAPHHVAYPAVYRGLMALALALLALSWVAWGLALRPVGDVWPTQIQWAQSVATVGASAPWWPMGASSDRPPEQLAAAHASPASSPDDGLKLLGGVTGRSVFVLVQKSAPGQEPARMLQPGEVLDGRWRLESISQSQGQGALKTVWRDIHTQQERVLMAAMTPNGAALISPASTAPVKPALPPDAVIDSQKLSRIVLPGP